MSLLPYRFAKHHQIVLEQDDEHYTLYYSDTLSPAVFQAVHRKAGDNFQISQVASYELTQLLEKHYKGQDSDTSEAIEALSEEHDLNQLRDQFAHAEDLLDSHDDAPIIKLINALLTKAIKDKASDIHIESFQHRIAIRLRVDGVLHEVMQPPIELSPFIIARIKVMAGLDIAEKRLPQDGRISTQIAGRNVDIRVSTLPVANAERVVMRILDKDATNFSLDGLTIPDDIKTKIRHCIHLPHGIFLVAGPTGSGKTTTLYASLSDLDVKHKNIMTVEDPIEYFFDGISQTQVNTKTGMDFSKGLRAILRQDPDIVMVGEIRDIETAKMAVQASLTGHTVFSTIHTNTAIGAVMRLKDMGIEPFLIGASLSGVLSQRLVRKLCPHCKVEKVADNSIDFLKGGESYYHPIGCEHCNQLGYLGRIGIYELIEIDDTLRGLIHQEVSEEQLLVHARNQSKSIYDCGIQLIRDGVTSIEEVMRVAIQ